ncbi:MAG: putative peroxidase, selenocysteine-containing [Verrucomicrobiales bacterium]|nr:putative peroxidase, selenocysteine-containing [Verrucomicrobiales bacterium]
MTKIAFQRLRDTGEAIPEILHLFRFKRRSTDHMVRFTEEVMRGPSPLSPGIRELIGAFFSKHNQCSFCSDAHAAAAAQLLGPELVEGVLIDLESSRLDLAHKELFRYVAKLAENPAMVTGSDIQKLKKAGWSEEAIYDALTVASVFRFYNTWNNGSGVRNMTPADYEHSGQVLNTMGYCMDFKWRGLTFKKLGAIIKAFFSQGRKRTSRLNHAPAQSMASSPKIALTCKVPVFTPVEKSFFKEEDLTISARDE